MELILTHEKHGSMVVLIDDEDWDKVKNYKWKLYLDNNNKFYVRCHTVHNGLRKSPRIHRMIMGATYDSLPHIDHINGCTLDNRKCNLRFATITENSRNVGKTIRNTTGYKGVYQYKKGHNKGLYTAALRCKDKKYFGGYFKTAIEAARKYDELAKKHHGEFAYLNFK